MAKKQKDATLVKDDAFRELDVLAKSKDKTIREIVMDEEAEAFNTVVDIFYKHLPQIVKWTMNKDKFKIFFLKNREMMLGKAGL